MKNRAALYHHLVCFLVSLPMLVSSQLVAMAASDQQESLSSNIYRVPLSGEPTTLDPALYSDIYAMQLANNIFDGLVEFDENLNVVPAIAQRWKISRDRRSYTFVLREGITFHNGREVTAEDFVYSFTRLLDPSLNSPAANLFIKLKGAEEFQTGKNTTVSGLSAIRPHLLKIELKEPFAPFLAILAMANAKVVPHEAVDSNFGTNPVGTGAFRFKSWQTGKLIELSAYEAYFAGQTALDGISFHIYPNIQWEEIFADFKAGNLEHAMIPREELDQLKQSHDHQSDYQLVSKSGLNLVYVGINQGVEAFTDLRVRQALNYAVDTHTIVNTITKRGTTPVDGILPPGIAGYDPDFEGYGYDPEKSRELLAAAGYPDGQGLPTIELWTVSKSTSVRNELEAYQRYLTEVGLTVEIQTAESWEAFVKEITDNRASLYYASWYADYPDADNFFYPLTHSSSPTNRMKFSNPEVDELVEDARSEVEYLERTKLYRNLEKLVMENAPIISQHANANNYLFQPWVENVQMSALGIVYLPMRQIQLNHQRTPEQISLAE